MSKEYISIQDASDLSNKSVQTIRRAIKSKKLACRKRKTPQGFNYLISRASLCEIYNLPMQEDVDAKIEETTVSTQQSTAAAPEEESQVKKAVKNQVNKVVAGEEDTLIVTSEDFREFTRNLETMLHQHSEERQNFLRLVNTLQEKIFVLENQLKLLQSPPKKWYSFWK